MLYRDFYYYFLMNKSNKNATINTSGQVEKMIVIKFKYRKVKLIKITSNDKIILNSEINELDKNIRN